MGHYFGKVKLTFFIAVVSLAFIPRMGVAQLTGQEVREEDPTIRTVIGLTRFRPDSTDIAVAKLLLNFKNGPQTPENCLEFYTKLADLKATMFTVIRVKRDILAHEQAHPELREKFFGETYKESGSAVEMKLLQYRRQVTMDGIKHVLAKFKGRVPNGTVWLAEIGKWATQAPKAMTFAGDIDFSFVSNDMELTMAMKQAFEEYIKKTTGLSAIDFDSVCTAHGRAGPEVYITHAGQLYGQEQMENGYLKPIDLTQGVVENKLISGALAILGMTIQSESSKTPGVTIPPRYNKEPGLSMEMVRHFNHDIVAPDLFDAVDSILKASKYVGRSMAERKGAPPDALKDAGLVNLANEITKAVQKTPDWVKVAELSKGYFGDAFRYKVVKEGTRPVARLDLNQRVIQDFFRDCNRLMWDNVMEGMKFRLADATQKGDELVAKDKNASPLEKKAYWEQLRDLKDMVETELAAMKKDHIDQPDEFKSLYTELIKAIDGYAKKLKMKTISEDMLKQKKFIEEMIKAKTPTLHAVAIAAIVDGTMKGIEKGNAILDFVDDALLGELRGQNKSFDEFVLETRKVELDIELNGNKGTTAQKLGVLKGQAVRMIQASNIKMNEVLNATSTRRGLMKGFMGANLAMEAVAYKDAWEREGLSGLATELFRRRIPGVSAGEAYYNGNYGRAFFDLVYTIFPPAGIPEGLKGMGEALYGYSYESWWSSELELFTDTLYEWAEFSKWGGSSNTPAYRLEFIRYEGRPYMRGELDSGASKFFEDPAFSLILSNNLASTDLFLGYYDESLKHEATGDRTLEIFREKARLRWEQVKRDFVKRMIARLEQRKASEKAIETGEIGVLFAELQKVARELRIEGALFTAMDKEWDSNNLKAFWNWIKNEKRTGLGQSLSETEKNRAATVVRSYVEAYREVLQIRSTAEKTVEAEYVKAGLAAPQDWNDSGLRWLSGIQMLSCKPSEDRNRAKEWADKIPTGLEKARAKLKMELDNEVPDATPDKEFDARISVQYMAAMIWKQAYEEAAVIPPVAKTMGTQKYQTRQNELMEEFLAYYRERTRPVVVQVFQLLEGKRTATPINTAEVKGYHGDKPGQEILFVPVPKAPGAYVASGLKPGPYTVRVSAAGFITDGRREVAEAAITLAPGRETPAPLSFWLAPEQGMAPLSITIKATPEDRRISNGTKTRNVAVLSAFVTAQPDSGKLHMEWISGNEELAKGYDCREARFIGEGRQAGTYSVTFFVKDTRGREAHAEVSVDVIPSEGYELRFAGHRPEIVDGESELIKIEVPRDEGWDYLWQITDEKGKLYSEARYGNQWTLDSRHFPGRTVTVSVKAQNKRGEKADGSTSVKVCGETNKTVGLINPSELGIVVEPREVTIGQPFKVTIKGADREDAVVYNWMIDNKDCGLNLLCITNEQKGLNGIYQFVANEFSVERFPCTVRLQCKLLFLNNKTSFEISSEPFPVRLPFSSGTGEWAVRGPGEKLSREFTFSGSYTKGGENISVPQGLVPFYLSIENDENVVSSGMWLPGVTMTVWGHKGIYRKGGVYNFVAGHLQIPNDNGDDPDAEEFVNSGFGFYGIENRSRLTINAAPKKGYRFEAIILNGGEKLVQKWMDIVEESVIAFLQGQSYIEPPPLTLNGTSVPIITIHPNPGLPWKKGSKASLTATLKDAPQTAGPITFRWDGAVKGTGSEMSPLLDKTGHYLTTVMASGANGEVARQTFEWDIKAIDLKIDRTGLPTALRVGDKVTLSAVIDQPTEEGYWFKWDSDQDVEFKALDDKASKVTATFIRPGKTRLLTTLYKKTGASSETLAEAEPIEMEVGKPGLTLTAIPVAPWVGQRVTVTASDTPRSAGEAARFIWSKTADALEAGPLKDDRIYTFRHKDPKPLTVTALMRGTEHGDDLAEASILVQAKPYDVKVSEPHLQGLPPMRWDEKAMRLVEVPRALGVDQRATVTATVTPAPEKGNLRYRWAGSPAGCTVADAGGAEATFSAHEPGAYTITVMVRDENNVELGTGSGSATVVPDARNQPPPAKGMEEARKAWGAGKIDEAVTLADQARQANPNDDAIGREVGQMRKDRDAIRAALREAEGLKAQLKLTEAGNRVAEALRLNGQYPPTLALRDEIARLTELSTKATVIDGLIARKQVQSAIAVQIELGTASGALQGAAVNTLKQAVEGKVQAARQQYQAFIGQKDQAYNTCAGRLDWKRAKQAAEEKKEWELSGTDAKTQAGQVEVAVQKAQEQDAAAQAIDVQEKAVASAPAAFFLSGEVDKAIRDLRGLQPLFGAWDPRQSRLDDVIKKLEARKQAEGLWRNGEQELANDRPSQAEPLLAQSLGGHPNPARQAVLDNLTEANRIWKAAQVQYMDWQARNDPDAVEVLEAVLNMCRESLKRIPSKGRQAFLDERTQYAERKRQALALWQQGLGLIQNDDEKSALTKLEESVAADPLPTPARKAFLARLQQANLLWKEGGQLYGARKYDEALAPYKASVTILSGPGRASAVLKLEQRRTDSLGLWREGEILEKSGKIPDLVAANKKYLASLALWIDPAREKQANSLQARLDQMIAEVKRNRKREYIFDNYNIEEVQKGPAQAPAFAIQAPRKISILCTYHWWIRPEPGTLGLRDQNGKLYGPFQAIDDLELGVGSNINWVAFPDITLPPGTYTVVDSDPASWSHNTGTKGLGFAQVGGLAERVTPEAEPSSWIIGKWRVSMAGDKGIVDAGQIEFLENGLYSGTAKLSGYESEGKGLWTLTGTTVTQTKLEDRIREGQGAFQVTTYDRAKEKPIVGTIEKREGNNKFLIVWKVANGQSVQIWYER